MHQCKNMQLPQHPAYASTRKSCTHLLDRAATHPLWSAPPSEGFDSGFIHNRFGNGGWRVSGQEHPLHGSAPQIQRSIRTPPYQKRGAVPATHLQRNAPPIYPSSALRWNAPAHGKNPMDFTGGIG